MQPNQNTPPAGALPPVPPAPEKPEPIGGTQPQVPAGIYPAEPSPGPVVGAQPPKPPEPAPKKRREGWRSVASTAALLILAPLIALAITAFAFQSYQVEGASMETTLSNNDRLIVNKISRSWARVTKGHYTPERGDIIIFNLSGSFDGSGGGQKQLIKRVIGLPGDRVIVQDGKVTVINAASPDGFDPDNSGLYKINATTTGGEVDTTVEEGEVFVLGDNRGNSEDSRYFGPIDTDDIVGKLSLRIAPLDKIQKF